jgi:hypothetical protein
MIKTQLRKTNKICRNLWDERRRSLCVFCLSLSRCVCRCVVLVFGRFFSRAQRPQLTRCN